MQIEKRVRKQRRVNNMICRLSQSPLTQPTIRRLLVIDPIFYCAKVDGTKKRVLKDHFVKQNRNKNFVKKYYLIRLPSM